MQEKNHVNAPASEITSHVYHHGADHLAAHYRSREVSDVYLIERHAIRGMIFREGTARFFQEMEEKKNYRELLGQLFFNVRKLRVRETEEADCVNALEYVFVNGQLSYTKLVEVFSAILIDRSISYCESAIDHPRNDHEKQGVLRGINYSDQKWTHLPKEMRRDDLEGSLSAAQLGLRVVGAGLFTAKRHSESREDLKTYAQSIYELLLPLATQSIKRFTPEHIYLMNAAFPNELHTATQEAANFPPSRGVLLEILKECEHAFDLVTRYQDLETKDLTLEQLPREFQEDDEVRMTATMSPEQREYVTEKLKEVRKNLRLFKTDAKKAWRDILDIVVGDHSVLEPVTAVWLTTFQKSLRTKIKYLLDEKRSQQISNIGAIVDPSITGAQFVYNPNFVEVDEVAKKFELKTKTEHKNGRDKKIPKILGQIFHHSGRPFSEISNTEMQSRTGCMGLAELKEGEMDDALYAKIHQKMKAFYGADFKDKNINAVSISTMMMYDMALELDPDIKQ